MRRSPPKSTIADIPRPILPEPNAAVKSSAPAVVVACWCGLVERMDRRALDRFTRDIWRGFDPKDLEPLKWAILWRRRLTVSSELACDVPSPVHVSVYPLIALGANMVIPRWLRAFILLCGMGLTVALALRLNMAMEGLRSFGK
jgi:hypothetical protein